MDEAHKETDKLLANMEKKLDSVYKQAYQEAKKTANDFTAQFRKMDYMKRKEVEAGELDIDEYNRWRRTKVFQGKRYNEMADTLAADMTNTNKMAASVINGYLPEVYAINHNYGTYEIEHGAKVNTQYTLYDRQTVERLMRDEPDLLPMKAKVNVPKDLLWNKKNINSVVTQGILQGDTIEKISDRLASTVTDMSHTSAVRSARTMTTSAENGGRVDSYKRAESMGISMLQQWLATLDGRTRHEHRQLDGQKRPVGEPFEVDGYKIDFPADPKAEPFLVYNCRCTLIAQVKGVNLDLSDVTQRDSKLGDMTYQQWKDEKRKYDDAEPEEKPTEPAKIHKKSLDFSEEDNKIKVSKECQKFINELKTYDIESIPTKELEQPLSVGATMYKVGGGDMTEGSCMSLSLAYAGNRGGIDVLDFRGGKSQTFFSRDYNIKKIANFDGVICKTISDFNDFTAVTELLKEVEDKKEYILVTGRHAAVIRKAEKGFEYLELQSYRHNGFNKLDKKALKDRFKCQRSYTVARHKLQSTSYLFDVESVSKSNDVKAILSYINTPADKQMKGAKGYAK